MYSIYDKLWEIGKMEIDESSSETDDRGSENDQNEPIVYNELVCKFERIESDQVFVSVDDKIFSYTVTSPYSFLGIKKGAEIVLKVPDGSEHDIALKLSDEGILN